MIRTGVVTATAAALMLVGGPATASTDGSLRVDWQVTQDDDRPAITATVTNTSTTDLANWQVTVPVDHLVSRVSGAISVQDSDRITLSADRILAAGASTAVQLRLIRLGDGSVAPTWCTSPQLACEVDAQVAPEGAQGSSPAPSSSPSQDAGDPEEPGSAAATRESEEPDEVVASSEPTPPATVTPDEPDAAVADLREQTPNGAVTLSYRISRDWGSGQAVVMSVTNEGPTSTDDWIVEVPADVTVRAMWGAESLSGGGTIRAQDLGWNSYLAPGDTVEFGFIALPGRNPEWQECRARVDDRPATCSIAAADSWLGYPQWPLQW